eukprot:s472_g12.t1
MLREILPVVQGHSCLTADCEGDCVALVVTICTKHFENQVLQFMQKEGRLILEDDTPFDNKGWTQCKVYILRKPLATQLDQKGCALEATSTSSGYVRENRRCWEMVRHEQDFEYPTEGFHNKKRRRPAYKVLTALKDAKIEWDTAAP